MAGYQHGWWIQMCGPSLWLCSDPLPQCRLAGGSALKNNEKLPRPEGQPNPPSHRQVLLHGECKYSISFHWLCVLQINLRCHDINRKICKAQISTWLSPIHCCSVNLLCQNAHKERWLPSGCCVKLSCLNPPKVIAVMQVILQFFSSVLQRAQNMLSLCIL